MGVTLFGVDIQCLIFRSRGILFFLAFIVLCSFSESQTRLFSQDNPSCYSSELNPTGDPRGGGTGYSKLVTHYDYYVETYRELVDAISLVSSGEIIYIGDHAKIDLSTSNTIVIPEETVLASGRGTNGALGALIYSENPATNPLFSTGGDGVRITGLRLRGPDPERRTAELSLLNKKDRYNYTVPFSRGVQSCHSDLEVDNCEIWGWSQAAIYLVPGAAHTYIHHNYIHHNQRYGLGYGVALDQASALIEANIFDWCRHAIAGTGKPGTSYEARYNLVLENANSHSFDMHGGKDRKDGTNIAGDSIRIHHNIFKAIGYPAVVIRGKPRALAEIHNNLFFHTTLEKAIRQRNGTDNIHIWGNKYGD